mgnify:CR=1 FL=1
MFTKNSSPDSLQQEADLLKAMGHPIRLCILHGLRDGFSANVSHLQKCLMVPQSTLSQHLGILRHAGIIAGDRKGTEIQYRIIDQRVNQLLSLLILRSKTNQSSSEENGSLIL